MRVAVSLVLLVGCSKASSDGLPPATQWQGDDPAAVAGTMPSRPRTGTPSSDPHAAVLGGTDGDEEGGADPHAGVPGAPPIGRSGGGDPHAGVPGAPPIAADPGRPGAAVDVTQLGFASPDPNRPIDPSRHIKGILKLDPKLKDRAKTGDAVFLMVRKPNADGQPGGAPIAVERIAWSGDSVAFELSEKNAMIAGAPDLVGELFVMARIDHDQDAMTRQPGDVTGLAKVTIPADGVVVALDTVLP